MRKRSAALGGGSGPPIVWGSPGPCPPLLPSEAALRRKGQINTRLRHRRLSLVTASLFLSHGCSCPGSPLAGAGVFVIPEYYSEARWVWGLALGTQIVLRAASRALPAPAEPGVRPFSRSATCLDVKIHFLIDSLQTPFGLLRVFSVVIPFLYVGTQISKNFAALLEEHDIFVPEDDDDDD